MRTTYIPLPHISTHKQADATNFVDLDIPLARIK
jgi:hypothetical protein